jgi:signal transduction histidine kinase
MEEVVRGLHEMNLRSRLLIHGLARGEIRAGDLPQSLEALAEDTRRMSGLECSFSHDGAQVENDQTATHLYRICQEAVNNAVRHARADRIRISLHHDPAGEHLCVEDNGVGMSLPTKTPEGQGLKIMNARSKIIGASLEIVPATGGGTRVLCRLPEGQILATGQDHDRYRPI